MPRWLVLLLVGIALGAGGVLFLQTNYGPQRLTVEQSEQLHTELSAANLERQRLQTQLDEAIGQRDATNPPTNSSRPTWRKRVRASIR
ncbi:inner membrane protein [Bordetella pertussis]|nr:inner membrane protein [Bordetella pertussis]